MPFQLGSAYGRIDLDVSRINAALVSASNQLKTFEATAKRVGTSLKAAGDSLTAGLTLPLAGAGVAVGKVAMDFEHSMQQIVGLVGVSQKQVDAWGQQILTLGPQLSRPPKELAEALYFVTSSGIDTSKAIDAVTVSAKAAAAGLGETQVVADAVTSALNAYAGTNLTAAQAAAILVATVREGKGEANAIAPALGRVIPVAAQLGVSFDQVGAAMASMTLVGFDAAESATNLSGIFSSFLKPSKQARDTLERFGLSAEGLRRQLAEEGLLATLRTLASTIGDDDEALAAIFPNVRAFRGLLSLVGENADQVEQVFKDLAGTTEGELDRAFESASNTSKFQFNQALAQVQAAAVKFGDAVNTAMIPVLQNLAQTLSNVATAFASLDPATQQTIISVLALVAALGPLLSIAGRLISAFGALITVVRTVGGAILQGARLAGMFVKTGFEVLQYLHEAGALTGTLALKLGILGAGLVVIAKFLEQVGVAANATNEELVEMSRSGDLFKQAAASFEIGANGSKRLHDVFVQHQADMRQKLALGLVTLDQYNAEMQRSADVINQGRPAYARIITDLGLLTEAQAEELRANQRNIDAAKRLGDTRGEAIRETRKQREELGKLGVAAVNAAGDIVDLAQSEEAFKAAQAAANAALEQLHFLMDGPVGDSMKEHTEKIGDLKTREQELLSELHKLEASHGRQVQSQKESSLSAEQLAYKQALLADKAAKLAGIEDQNSLAALKLKSEMAGLEEQIGKTTGAQTTYIDNSKRIGEIKGELEGVKTAYAEEAAAFEDRTRRILFSIAEQQLAALAASGKITFEQQLTALTTLAERWGMVDSATATATANILRETTQLAQTGDINAFMVGMEGAFNVASGKAQEWADSIQTNTKRIKEEYLPAQELAFEETGKTIAEEMEKAKVNVGDKNAEMTESFRVFVPNVQQHVDAFPAAVSPIATAMNGAKTAVETAVGNIISKVQEMVTAVAEAMAGLGEMGNVPIPTPGGSAQSLPVSPVPGSSTTAKQFGGWVRPRVAALINEHALTRPEVVIAPRGAHVLTRQQAQAALAGAAGMGAGVQLNYYTTINNRLAELAWEDARRRERLRLVEERFG